MGRSGSGEKGQEWGVSMGPGPARRQGLGPGPVSQQECGAQASGVAGVRGPGQWGGRSAGPWPVQWQECGAQPSRVQSRVAGI